MQPGFRVPCSRAQNEGPMIYGQFFYRFVPRFLLSFDTQKHRHTNHVKQHIVRNNNKLKNACAFRILHSAYFSNGTKVIKIHNDGARQQLMFTQFQTVHYIQCFETLLPMRLSCTNSSRARRSSPAENLFVCDSIPFAEAMKCGTLLINTHINLSLKSV